MSAKFVNTDNAFLKTNAATAFGGLDNFSLMAWIKRTSPLSSANQALWGINHRAAAFARTGGADLPHMVATATTYGTASYTPFVASVWYHVILKRDGSGASASTRMYINGVDQGDLCPHNGDLIADDVVTVARSLVGGADSFDGQIADFAIFDTALSDPDCAKPYAQRKTIQDLNQSGALVDIPVAGWLLNGVTGNITNGDAGLNQWSVTGPTLPLIVGGGTPTWVNDSPFAGARGATTRPDGGRPYFDRPHYARIWRPPLA